MNVKNLKENLIEECCIQHVSGIGTGCACA